MKEREEANRRGGKNHIERERGERNKKGDFPNIPTVKARRSKKKIRSTHCELRVGIKILEFRQTPRGRKFFYLDYF